MAVAGMSMSLMAGAATGTADAAPAHRAAPQHLLTPPPPPHRVVQGTAVRLETLHRDRRYRDLFLREFDALTPENEMKMAFLQPRRGAFDFAAADALVAFAKENQKQIHGHALVWGLQLPLWLIDQGATDNLGLHLPPMTRNELLGVMRNHIDTVMRHFGDDVPEWDVVNEPMDENGALASNVWRRFIGDDYIEQALRSARAANPRAKLFINEYAVEGPSAKLEGLIRLVRDLKARNVPLDGVGLQYHTNTVGFYGEQTLTETMRRFAALGVELEITEMDVGTSLLEGSTEQSLALQATAYGDAARACNAVEACTRFTTWGFTDRVSWLGPTEMALPFDTQYQPKPAFEAVRSAFATRSARSSRRLWHMVRPAGRGRVSVRKTARTP